MCVARVVACRGRWVISCQVLSLGTDRWIVCVAVNGLLAEVGLRVVVRAHSTSFVDTAANFMPAVDVVLVLSAFLVTFHLGEDVGGSYSICVSILASLTS